MMPRRFHPAPAIDVWSRADGTPYRLVWKRRAHPVARVENTWAMVHGWWQGAGEALDRRYFDLTTRDGLRCVVYRDKATDGWHLEQILD
jgi:hypothetical protein